MALSPTNPNYLSGLAGTFSIKRMPTVSFFATRVNLPGLSMSSPELNTPFKIINLAPDKIDYAELSVTFKVDEDLKNYLEIFNWMVGIGFPRDFDQRKALALDTSKVDGIYSDGVLMINNSARVPNIRVRFIDLLPVSLSDLNFDVGNVDVDYVEAVVQFKYLYHQPEKLSDLATNPYQY
jgi:hypothetical protein